MEETDPYYALLSKAASTPDRYKICLVCGNIVDAELESCSYCYAFRFDTDPEHVSNTALDQATHTRSAITNIAVFAED